MDRHQQLLANIATIIECIQSLPGVVKVEVEDVHAPSHTPSDEDNYEKKAWITFAGCKEQVIIELY